MARSTSSGPEPLHATCTRKTARPYVERQGLADEVRLKFRKKSIFQSTILHKIVKADAH